MQEFEGTQQQYIIQTEVITFKGKMETKKVRRTSAPSAVPVNHTMDPAGSNSFRNSSGSVHLSNGRVVLAPTVSVIPENSTTIDIHQLNNPINCDPENHHRRKEKSALKQHSKYASSDSLHSQPQQGHLNSGFVGSAASLRTTSTPSVHQVYREQYWSWSCKCRHWSKRERILVLVVTFLTFVVCGLVAVISVLADKRETLSSSTSNAWYSWKL